MLSHGVFLLPRVKEQLFMRKPMLMVICSLLPHVAQASVGKVYDPYVNAYESEIEYRAIYDDGESADPRKSLKQVLGFATGVMEGVAIEVSASHYEITDGANELRSAEVEVFWQLTEQGEYDSDWGTSFSLERNHVTNYWEASSKILMAHDFDTTSLILNAGINYSWGSGVDNEFEGEFRGAYVWRYSPEFAPSIEFHTSESLTSIGPVIGGKYRVAAGKALLWRTGVMFGIDTYTPNNIVKFELEYEF